MRVKGCDSDGRGIPPANRNPLYGVSLLHYPVTIVHGSFLFPCPYTIRPYATISSCCTRLSQRAWVSVKAMVSIRIE